MSMSVLKSRLCLRLSAAYLLPMHNSASVYTWESLNNLPSGAIKNGHAKLSRSNNVDTVKHGSRSSIFYNYGSGSGIRIPMRIRIQCHIQGFDDQKLNQKLKLDFFIVFFLSKTAIYLFRGLPKGRPSYRRTLQPSKKSIQYFKAWKFLTFFYFCG